MSFLLDTDTCSAYVKGNPLVFNRFLQYGSRLAISTITLGELFTWALRAKAIRNQLGPGSAACGGSDVSERTLNQPHSNPAM